MQPSILLVSLGLEHGFLLYTPLVAIEFETVELELRLIKGKRGYLAELYADDG